MNEINVNFCLINGSTLYRQYFMTVERTWVIKKVGIWSVLVYIEQIFLKSIWTLPVWIIGEERMLEHWKCKKKVDTNPKKCLLCLRIHGRYFKFCHLSTLKTEVEDEETLSEHLSTSPLECKLHEGRGFVFHCSFLSTHTSSWHIAWAQKRIVDKEWVPGSELINLKGGKKAEHSIILLWIGKFCLRNQEKKKSPKKIRRYQVREK